MVLGYVFSQVNASYGGGLSVVEHASPKSMRDWMAALPDHKTLADYSLPGTHNTCALYNGYAFGFAKCQSWTLKEQLQRGIRFLDIRCRHMRDTLQIYHGPIRQRMSFANVLDTCVSFLQENPTECIVISIKEEHHATGNSRDFKTTFLADVIRGGKDLWRIQSTIPQLKAVRGKWVLVDRVGDLGGIPWSAFMKQDDYRAPPDLKVELIREQFDNTAHHASNTRPWFINFCSGVYPSRLITPRQYALQANKAASLYIKERSSQATGPFLLGTVMMDFPSHAMIQQVIYSNFAPPK
ncbi:MAG: phosphatidylinositol-specific phospholipase C [Verrucomicrobiota bacterium]|nr:phosphatidylinositol-specific phospholipase C [Verrucomicrobiota bacterium]